MKKGSLKVVRVRLNRSSDVESILKALPQSKVEELAIGMVYYYSEEVNPQCVCVCMCVCVCAQLPISNKHCCFFEVQTV